MNRLSHHFAIASSLLALVVGCTAEPRDTLSRDEGNGHGCPPQECGVNGVYLAETHFGPLRLDGTPNARSFAIVDFVDRSGRSLALDVRAGFLVGLARESGDMLVHGDAVAGSEIVLVDAAHREWTLTVHSLVALPHTSDEPGSVPGYRISARGPTGAVGKATPLCRDGESALLIAGQESRDPVTLTAHDAGHRSFTLACTDHLLGKARRMSYDPDRAPDHPRSTTSGQRTATLRMLRADYCGTGQSFTRPGVPVKWQNRAGWMPYGRAPAAHLVAAAWDRHGATCMNHPRLPDWYARSDIEASCGRDIPRCNPQIVAGSEWVSWRP